MLHPIRPEGSPPPGRQNWSPTTGMLYRTKYTQWYQVLSRHIINSLQTLTDWQSAHCMTAIGYTKPGPCMAWSPFISSLPSSSWQKQARRGFPSPMAPLASNHQQCNTCSSNNDHDHNMHHRNDGDTLLITTHGLKTMRASLSSVVKTALAFLKQHNLLSWARMSTSSLRNYCIRLLSWFWTVC